MVRMLDARAPRFTEEFEALRRAPEMVASGVEASVRAIIDAVRTDGDAALAALTRQYDRYDPGPDGFRVSAAEFAAAVAAVPALQLDALDLAAARIEAYHARQIPADLLYTDEMDVELGWRFTPLDAVGLYVPGGKASYPSSVLMNAIPARLAGVRRIAMVVPTPDGLLNPLVLAAASRAGVTEIYRIGGAQAVAALAYGTAQIAPVDKIVGPGNAYVAAAKRIVFGVVGIDSIAGPSEIVIIADRGADPLVLAADLLSQAEHDAAAQSILFTDDAALAQAVAEAAARLIARSPRAEVTALSWRDHGAIIVVEHLSDAVPLVNQLAPEHLALAVAEPKALAAQIRHAGAIFLGYQTPEALGDYLAGANHVLPTAGAARYASGLSVLDFLKRTSLLRATGAALAALGPATITLAEAEGLWAHAESVRVRLDLRPGGQGASTTVGD